MSFSDILEILRRYGNFRDNHLLIIRALLNAEMSAEELCRSTGIPKGRIYEFLNYILDNRIVLAKGKHPKKYYIDSPQDSIARFLEKRFSDISIDEVSIRNIMANHKRVITVNNKDDYTDILRFLLVARKKFNIVTSILLPHLFYTNEDSIFDRFSQYFGEEELSISSDPLVNKLIRAAFWNAYKNSNEFIYVIDRESVEDYKKVLQKLFSKSESKHILSSIKDALQKKVVNIYISRVKNPYHMTITDHEICLATFGKKSLVGVFIRDSNICKVYDGMFKDLMSNSENLLLNWGKIFGN